jgi:hypothetical protein
MQSPSSQPPSSQPLTGKLWRVLILLGLSIFISYIDRSNLSIAAPLIKDELHLSASQLGLLLSSFFWTYAFLQLISGWLVDRLNVNWVFAGGFFLWSIATIVTGLVHGFFMLLLLRLLLGVGESVAYPSYSKIIALHYREEHRGIANSIISAGLALGPGFGLLAGGLLISRFGLADSLARLDAPSKSCHSSRQNSCAQLCSSAAAAFRLGNDHRAVWLQLRELLPAHLVAILSGARQTLFHRCHGQNRRHRLRAQRSSRIILRLALRSFDPLGRNTQSRPQTFRRRRPGRRRCITFSLRRQPASMERAFTNFGYRLPGHQLIQHLGYLSDSRRPVCRRTLDRFAKWLWKPGRHCRPGSHRIYFGSHRPLRMALRASCARGLGRRFILAFHCRPRPSSSLARTTRTARRIRLIDCRLVDRVLVMDAWDGCSLQVLKPPDLRFIYVAAKAATYKAGRKAATYKAGTQNRNLPNVSFSIPKLVLIFIYLRALR